MADLDHDPDLPDAELFDDAPGAEEDGGASLLARMQNVEAFAAVLKDLRKEAIQGRKASGIEEIWQEDEDHYEGRDAYNQPHGVSKGRTTSDTVTVNAPKKVKGRSTAFANITRPYCDAGAARVADMLLPTDDRNWAIRHTPVPSMVKGKDDDRVVVDDTGAPMMRPMQPGEEAAMPQAAPAPQSPGMLSRIAAGARNMMGMGQPEAAPEQQQKPVTVADMAKQAIDKAKQSASRAQDEIDDWLVECQYHAEVRKVIESSARIGVGILKGPHPINRTARAAHQVDGKWKLEIQSKTAPASMFVSAWNFYPDPNCGEDIRKGAFTFEYDNITAHALSELKGGKYIDEMIDMCLEEGPVDTNDGTKHLKDGETLKRTALFGIWYFNGMVPKKDMEAAGVTDIKGDHEPCIVTMVNDRIVKIARSPLDAGEFPYDVMVWQQKLGHWAGVGIARQMRTCQKGLNGAVRAMQDNQAISSGPQIIVDRNKVDPADGKWELTPRKIWWAKPSLTDAVFDARMAFMVVNIETRQPELLANIEYWTRAAEDITGLPMLIQGQQGAAPQTVGGMTMLNNNATSVLRRIARTFDDRITEPHIGRYYEWLLIHGPEEAKGDFQIDARGSSALVERDIQNQAMMQLLGLAVNPAYSLDPEKVMAEVLKGMRLDPSAFQMDDEKKAAMANQPPPEDPRVTAAKIMAESRGAMQQADHQHESQEGEAERAIKKMALSIEGELGAAGLTTQQQNTLENIKATLSGLTMKLQVQRELSGRATNADLYKHKNPAPVLTPPTEPVGKAPAGEAYAK